MPMQSLLVAAEDQSCFNSVLSTALLVARRFGSYIEGVAIRSPVVPFAVADGMSTTMTSALESIEAAEIERAERLREQFRDFVRAEGLVLGESRQKQVNPSADWPTGDSLEPLSLGHRGRLFDLIVVGRPERGKLFSGISVVEAALFDTGRPVLIAPPSPPETLGQTVVIAWNGSTESARAITFAMPFLERAECVSLIEVADGMVPGPSVTEVRSYLLRYGIDATAHSIESGDGPVGQAILNEAVSLGADLVVKGAYTHSRLRQMIFGGVTSYILGESTLPVLMAH